MLQGEGIGAMQIEDPEGAADAGRREVRRRRVQSEAPQGRQAARRLVAHLRQHRIDGRELLRAGPPGYRRQDVHVLDDQLGSGAGEGRRRGMQNAAPVGKLGLCPIPSSRSPPRPCNVRDRARRGRRAEDRRELSPYVDDGHYDGTIFHRVIPGFMAQGGGYDAYEKKPTRAPVENEARASAKNVRGTVAMARTSDPHSATAQFFVNVADNAFARSHGKYDQRAGATPSSGGSTRGWTSSTDRGRPDRRARPVREGRAGPAGRHRSASGAGDRLRVRAGTSSSRTRRRGRGCAAARPSRPRPGAPRAAQLPHELGALREAGGAERVALREQAARRVRDELAAVGVVAVPDELLGLAFLHRPSAS